MELPLSGLGKRREGDLKSFSVLHLLNFQMKCQYTVVYVEPEFRKVSVEDMNVGIVTV